MTRADLHAMPGVEQTIGAPGMRFTRAMVSVSLCCPSRTTILRGQYAHNTGVETNGGTNGGFEAAYRFGVERSTVATWLHRAGYRTGLIGKYLNGFPNTASESYRPPGWTTWVTPVAGNPYNEYGYRLDVNGQFVDHGFTAGRLRDVRLPRVTPAGSSRRRRVPTGRSSSTSRCTRRTVRRRRRRRTSTGSAAGRCRSRRRSTSPTSATSPAGCGPSR